MQYTPLQKKVLRELGYCKVNRREMWKDGELGYCSKGGLQYDVNIASDAPDPDNVPDIVLLHEIGHIYYGHVDRVDQKTEFKEIEKICQELNKPFAGITMVYGGPHNFLNICMDLEINSSILNKGNIEIMKKNNLGLWTPESANIAVEDTFRDYYRPLIARLPDKDQMQDELQKAMEQMRQEDQQRRGNSSGKGGPGKGMQDLASDEGLGLDPDLSEELKDAIRNEDYTDGNTKSAKKNITNNKSNGKGETVDEAVDKNDVRNNPMKGNGGGEGQKAFSKGYGTGSNASGTIDLADGDPEKAILKFLEEITDAKMEYTHDSLRHHNHGTRMNDAGLLYNSMKRKRLLNNTKLGILVDVSGSMNITAITNAAKTISNAHLNKQSVFCTWNTSKVEEFPIDRIPAQIRTGGGTSMDRGLKHLVDEGMKDIVIYSDFETSIPPLVEEAESAIKKGCKIYSIIATTKGQEKEILDSIRNGKSELGKYFKGFCKKNIVVGTN